MSIDWTTFALQTVNFAVLVWLLQRLLYRPVRAVIDDRRMAAVQTRESAERAVVNAERRHTEYDAMCRETESLRHSVVEAAHTDAARERDRILADAAATVRETVAAGERDVERARDQALRDIREHTVEIAVELAGKLLADTASDTAVEAFLDRAVVEIAAMPEPARDGLRDALGAEGAVLTLACAPLPSDDAQARWVERLREALGIQAEIRFLAAPSLIAGIELRFPGTTLRFAWADTLARARRRLASDDRD